MLRELISYTLSVFHYEKPEITVKVDNYINYSNEFYRLYNKKIHGTLLRFDDVRDEPPSATILPYKDGKLYGNLYHINENRIMKERVYGERTKTKYNYYYDLWADKSLNLLMRYV